MGAGCWTEVDSVVVLDVWVAGCSLTVVQEQSARMPVIVRQEMISFVILVRLFFGCCCSGCFRFLDVVRRRDHGPSDDDL